MYATVYYLVRSKQDGQYLVARPRRAARSDESTTPAVGFVLLFQEHADALTYLNTHAGSLAERFAIESLPGSQLNGLMKRWGFEGFGLVKDPLLPQVDFLVKDPDAL